MKSLSEKEAALAGDWTSIHVTDHARGMT
jgi:hypothetical protein